MFGKQLVTDMISRSAESGADRRAFLRTAGVAGLGVIGATAVAAPAQAHEKKGGGGGGGGGGISDGAILNFALNLEYLEAEFYSRAFYGRGLDDGLTTGRLNRGDVNGGRKVQFKSKLVRGIAEEIANDEIAHVKFLRGALGGAAVARPAIDFTGAFNAAAKAAGLIKDGQTFDAFADDTSFLLGAFLFEDVGVTAYKGGAPLISSKTYLDAAAGILAVEAYHAGAVRTVIYTEGLADAANKISDARDSLDGKSDDDQGVSQAGGRINVTPVDGNAIAFGRTPQQVHNIAYLNPAQGVRSGGFFPAGTNNEDSRLTTT
ncbi:ferritin-like domain-containing protein [Quadrisphaera setariae]|uniref:Ferritin-like domain-containing protein n=1 Tax=Quadrisphaera setariae TaxID=2593304 RepID=A0A5C8Z5W0_9ACTN|nr:ferritin-like domain-containing protein [Quadrisphaera setariae]TXR52296.1 ferritin-like domain-containing protein [Quadrisphaera setariae]